MSGGPAHFVDGNGVRLCEAPRTISLDAFTLERHADMRDICSTCLHAGLIYKDHGR